MALFGGKKKETVVLVDVGSGSVAASYALFETDQLPRLYYSVRVPVEPHEGEEILPAMLRTLAEVGRLLIAEGTLVLQRETGSVHVHSVLASVGAPWQSTTVRAEHIAEKSTFTFTEAKMHEAVSKAATLPEGYIQSSESVISTSLNGYETTAPFGRHAKRVDLVIVSSAIEKHAAHEIETALRKVFHTHTIELTAFQIAGYSVFRDIYPHQKDFILLDVSGTHTDAAFVKHGILVGVNSIPHGIHELLAGVRSSVHTDAASPESGQTRTAEFAERVQRVEALWLDALQTAFREFAGNFPLPRTIFLLSDDASRDFLKRILDTSSLRTLWLSDEPLTIIPVLPSHFSTYLTYGGTAQGDIYLADLALFYQKKYGQG